MNLYSYISNNITFYCVAESYSKVEELATLKHTYGIKSINIIEENILIQK